MPCDTRIRTSQVDLGAANLDRLAKVLTATGWEVTRSTLDARSIIAWRAGVRLEVSGRETKFTTSTSTDLDEAGNAIRRAYAARTVQEVSARFGFKVKGAEKLLGGAQRLLLHR